MFFTASGSIFEIGSARPDWQARQVSASDFDGEVWTPVAGLNSLGRIAGEWQTEETIRPDGYAPDEPPIPTIEKIARRMGVSDHPLERFRVLNGLSSNERIKPGEKVKIVVE